MSDIKRVKARDIELTDRLVGIQRVTKVTKGGRTFSFSAIVVVGDGNGIVGHGLGKSQEVTVAISKAIDSAKKNLVKVPVQNGTIPHEQEAKYSGSQVLIKPASNGTGVKAGGAMRAVLEAAGVKNVLSKCVGTTRPVNVVRSTVNALTGMSSPDYIAAKRGKSVDEILGE